MVQENTGFILWQKTIDNPLVEILACWGHGEKTRVGSGQSEQ